MDFLALHVYHLDDDEEAERVVQLLESTGIGREWPIERPTEETNAIFIPIEVPDDVPAQVGEARWQKLEKSLDLLRDLDREAIDAIKALDLKVAMRVGTSESYLPLPEEFVSECGRLGLSICIFNCSQVLSRAGLFG